MLDESKVATSLEPLGGPPVDQLAAVFQSPEVGAASQLALPAELVDAIAISTMKDKAVPRTNLGTQ